MFWDILETSQYFDRRYCAQNVTGANRYTLLPKPISKNSHNKNIDGPDFITILLKFAGLYHVIAVDHYLFIYRYLSNVTNKNSASSYLNISFG